MTHVNWQNCGHFWLVEIDNPPVNATSTSVRQGLMEAVTACHNDNGEKKAVILVCKGRSFIAGGDITEFDAPPQEPHLPDVCNAIEDADLPWIAVMHGHVLGGGLEIAMSCAFRIAHKDTKFGMTEVKVGLIPGAGGSQRLPRLIGLDAAIPMLTAGQLISSNEFSSLGGLDKVHEDPDGQSIAISYLQALPSRPIPISQRNIVITDPEILERAEAKLKASSKGDLAALANLKALQLAVETSFDKGQPIERERHLKMRNSAESRALRHAFLAERQVSKPVLIKGSNPKEIKNVVVVGGGLMGAGIAFSTLMASYEVTLIERDENAVNGAKDRLSSMMESAIKRGKITEERGKKLLNSVSLSTDYNSATNADIAIEAVFEDIEVKKNVFKSLDAVMREDAILASNTSYLDPNLIMQGLANSERMLGLHFFSPAHIMKLVEVITLDNTHPDIVATGFNFAKSLGKTGVLSRVCDGFIGNRILAAYRRQADYLLIDGATPSQIDRAMRNFGLNMGPYEMQDMAGLQIAWANRKRLAATRPKTERYVEIGDILCEMERFGQRTGKGWYRYEEGSRSPLEDELVLQLIEEVSQKHEITRQVFSDDEICQRLLTVMINEGALIVEEGIAERDLDIDIVKILGYGFPRWRGGPMNYANEIGWEKISETMSSIQQQSPNSWQRAKRLS